MTQPDDLRAYRQAYGTPDAKRIAHRVATKMGHLPLRQGDAVECARCGLSGSAREVLSGPVHLNACPVGIKGVGA